MHKALLVVAALSMLPAGPVRAASIHKEFREAWEARDSRLQAEYSTLAEAANASIDAFTEAANADRDAEEIKRLFSSAMDRVHEAATVRGRGLALNSLVRFVADKPSAARGEMWMQEQIDDLATRRAAVEALKRRMSDLKSGDGLPAIVDAMQRWTDAHGDLVGRTEELTLLDQNLASYFQARDAQQARRSAARRAALAGIAQALQDDATGAHPMMSSQLFTTCQTYGGVTNCRTR